MRKAERSFIAIKRKSTATPKCPELPTQSYA